MTTTGSLDPKQLIGAAAAALEARKDEVNRLNVFPVPDGDTGTNMALTMVAVVAEVEKLPPSATLADVCAAVTQGSLMGARGNSGVILSQILRGLCDVLGAATSVEPGILAEALANAVTVAFQAVRKPVEGTMLTVLRDTSDAAASASEAGLSLEATLERLAEESQESVRRTPDLLPVLAEAGVVDAGGFGLAILAEGLVAALEGHEVRDFDVEIRPGAVMAVEPANDWDDDEYLYCTEFLLLGDGLDRDDVERWVVDAGGSELVVGDEGLLKIHVHTDDPAAVIARATALGEIAEVHINNMRQQTEERRDALAAEAVETKSIGVVAVSAGSGMTEILKSLGVDAIVDGGQTMNPSTAQLIEAADGVPAETVIILPNNKNIILAAEQASGVSDADYRVVPTGSVPEAFAALLMLDPEGDADDVLEEMAEAAACVRVGEVTTAVKDSKGTKVGDIAAGQIIGIAEGEIEIVGDDVVAVAHDLLGMIADDGETLTVLAGEDLGDDALESLVSGIEEAFPDLEVDALRGEQPLYPVIMAVE